MENADVNSFWASMESLIDWQKLKLQANVFIILLQILDAILSRGTCTLTVAYCWPEVIVLQAGLWS